MSHGRADVRGKAGPGPDIRFGPRNPTSYSGPVILRYPCPLPGVGERPWGCRRSCARSPDTGGCATRIPTGMTGWPGAFPVRSGCRTAPRPAVRPPVRTDGRSVAEVRNESRCPVPGRLAREGFSRRHPITTGRSRAPGAVPKAPQRASKGKGRMRAATAPLWHHRRTDRIPDVLHRPGNVRDPIGADTFIGPRTAAYRRADHARRNARRRHGDPARPGAGFGAKARAA